MQLRETLRHYFKVFYARLGWVALGTIVCTSITFVVTSFLPATYEASSLILIDHSEEPSENAQYALLVKQEDILTQVARKVPDVSSTGLQSMINGDFRTDTHILTIRVQANNPELACQLANEVAHTFIQVQMIKDSVRLQQQSTQVESDLHTAKANLSTIQEKLRTMETDHSANDQIIQARMQADTYQLRYDTLFNLYHAIQEEQLKLNTHLTIAQEAIPPQFALTPNLPLSVSVSLILSAFILTCLFLTLDWLDTTIKTREDLSYLSQVTTFGAIPLLRFPRKQNRGTPFKDDPRVSVILDTIAMQIDRSRQGAHSLLVTSLHKQAGTSSMSIHIARFLARSGLRILLVDANLQAPTLHKVFPLDHIYGLLDKMDELFAIPEAAISRLYHWLDLWRTEEANLWVLPVGTGTTRTAWQIADIRHLKERMLGNPALHTPDLVDIIIFDAPPAPQTDIVPLAAIADTTLVVLSAGKTRPVELLQLQGALQRLGSNLLGVIINKQKRGHQTNLAHLPTLPGEQPVSILPPLPVPARFPVNALLLDTPPEVSVTTGFLLADVPAEEKQVVNLKPFGISLPGLQLKPEQPQGGLRLRSYFQSDQ